MKRALCLLLLLAGCAPERGQTYRDETVPLAITTRGTLGDLEGDWVVRGTFAPTASLDRIRFAARADGKIDVTITHTGCTQDCPFLSGTWPAERIARNRARLLTDSANDPELWVIWADEATRTAVIVTPDGRTAAILDRNAKGGADRIEAARQVMDFNGYDISALLMR